MQINGRVGWLLFVGIMLFALTVLSRGEIIASFRDVFMEETYQSDKLFKHHGTQVYRLAQKIERKQDITLDEVNALPDSINKRYGQDITLLFHAMSSYNLQAVDVILEAGADTTMPARLTKSPDFTYFLGMPGGDEGTKGDINFVNGLLKLYLKHGGDPNVRTEGNDMEPIIVHAALHQNIEGMRMLLAAGADFWATDERGSTAAYILAHSAYSDLLHEFIDAGYFNNPPEELLKKFFRALSGYTQRGDERSIQNQKVGRRVLRRNPFYEEDLDTKDLFQGPIPWKQILDEDY